MKRALIQKVHTVVSALHSFSRSWKHLQTEPCTDCVLEYASSTQAIQSSGSSFRSSCNSFRSHLQIWHRCCEVSFTVMHITKKDNNIHDHSYLLSTYRCWFVCEIPSVLAHSVILYYILQTPPPPS